MIEKLFVIVTPDTKSRKREVLRGQLEQQISAGQLNPKDADEIARKHYYGEPIKIFGTNIGMEKVWRGKGRWLIDWAMKISGSFPPL